jgi:protein associated with RNAse G/E
MSQLSIYRKRFIPNDFVHLKDDIILAMDDNLIITKWRPLRPKENMSGGVSAYYLKHGIKVSKIYNKDEEPIYWYCDIIQIKPYTNSKDLVYEDLLIDVVVYEDGSIRVLDLDELVDALERQLITNKEAVRALKTLDYLLKLIYRGGFEELQTPINRAEASYSSSII